MATVVNVLVDPVTKRTAQALAARLGITLSTVINASLEQFIQDKEITLSLAPKMTPYLESVVEQARAEYAVRPPKKYKTAAAFLAGIAN